MSDVTNHRKCDLAIHPTTTNTMKMAATEILHPPSKWFSIDAAVAAKWDTTTNIHVLKSAPTWLFPRNTITMNKTSNTKNANAKTPAKHRKARKTQE
jgi:hypothetical protein